VREEGQKDILTWCKGRRQVIVAVVDREASIDASAWGRWRGAEHKRGMRQTSDGITDFKKG